jgi:hypothetical protein
MPARPLAHKHEPFHCEFEQVADRQQYVLLGVEDHIRQPGAAVVNQPTCLTQTVGLELERHLYVSRRRNKDTERCYLDDRRVILESVRRVRRLRCLVSCNCNREWPAIINVLCR